MAISYAAALLAEGFEAEIFWQGLCPILPVHV